MESGAFQDRLVQTGDESLSAELRGIDPSNDLDLDTAARVLLQRFHERNEVACLALLYELCHPRLLILARQVVSKVGLAADPEDLTSAFMTKLFTDVRRPQAPVRKFLGFAFTSMKNDALNQVRQLSRSRKRMVRFQQTLTAPADPAQSLDERERTDACLRVGVVMISVVSRCFHALKERDRQVLLAREVQRMPYDELAQVMKIPQNQVGTVLRRARQRLAQHMAQTLARGGSEP
ncbi:MAG: RNA polymerase sigma factor (sigma-70 family) [Pseudohongiellaceae bacterium]